MGIADFFIMKRFLYSLFVGVFVIIALNISTQFAYSNNHFGAWEKGSKAQARLISSVKAVGDLDTIPIGLQIRLKPGWKTYWRSPGVSGLPPSADLSKSSNLSSSIFYWPLPYRFSYYDIDVVGYSNEVIFPIDLLLKNIGQPLNIRAIVEILVCDDVCIPHVMDLALDLPSGLASPTNYANIISRYRALVPGDGRNSGITFEGASYKRSSSNPILEVKFSSTSELVNPDLLVEGLNYKVFSKPNFKFYDNRKTVLIKVNINEGYGEYGLESLNNQPLRLTFFDGDRSIEKKTIPLQSTLSADKSDYNYFKLLSIIFVALLGGLLLNLMPCVLPVLSIKILTLVSYGGEDHKYVRHSFLATSAGIIFSFILLAIFVVAIKQAGLNIGWGIQFQQPLFITFMVIVLTLFAANAWGLYEIRLPSPISYIAENTSQGRTLKASFFEGAFATLLATPCSAPFLGTAVGFALSGGVVEIFLVFTSLAIGMSVPFLLLAIFPKFASNMPKPGQWMVLLKKTMSFILLATALWLLFIIKHQVSTTSALIIGSLMMLIIILLFLGKYISFRLLVLFKASICFIMLFALLTPLIFTVHKNDREDNKSSIIADWELFDSEKITELVRTGHVVFVDITAEWCITCQFNKSRVLQTKEIAELLNRPNVVKLRGDWTKPEASIANYLAQFKRFGVPLNVIYGPNFTSGLLLPEILSKKSILLGLKKAGFKLNLPIKNQNLPVTSSSGKNLP